MTSAPLRVYVETARLNIGGGVQVALEQLRHLASDPRLECTWRLSHTLVAEIEAAGLPLPARWEQAAAGFPAQARQLVRMLRAHRPDLVYTVFGPAHMPVGRLPHVCGFAGGWMMWPDNPAARRMSRKDLLRRRLGDRARRVLLRNAGYYVVETELARGRLLEMTGLPPDHVRVASNTCADVFRTWDPSTQAPDPRFARRSPDERLFFVLSSYYPHKNLEIVPAVARELAALGSRPFRFVLTLDPEGPGWRAIHADAVRLGVEHHVSTAGKLKLVECPGGYAACDALFLPTLLETFTASYPEAMQMRRPIVTPDLPFARGICEDAAVFYDAVDPASAAAALHRLETEGGLRERLVAAGTRRLGDFLDSKQRADAVVRFLLYAAGRPEV